MFKLDSEKTLLSAFRPKDRKVVELTKEVRLPLVVPHYLAWAHPAGGKIFLVFAVPGGAPTGIAFNTNGDGHAVPHMCDWCRSSGTGKDVSMLTTYATSRRVIGVQVCTDLSCARKLEDEADRSGVSVLPAMEQLVARMGRFAHKGLGIDLTAAGR